MLPYIVYLVEFIDRMNLEISPWRYIGSKSRAIVIDNKIIDEDGKEYKTSSCFKGFHEIFDSSDKIITCLGVFDNFEDMLQFEHDIHIKYDVAADTTYFNKVVASISSLTEPGYGTYKHKATGDVVRLPINHHLVGIDYFGVSKGIKLSKERIDKITHNSRNHNGFKGKSHTPQTKQVLSDKLTKFYQTDEGLIVREKIRQTALKQKGTTKSDDHKRKISESNKIIQNKILVRKSLSTGEVRVFSRDDAFDKSEWVSTSQYKVRMDAVKCVCDLCGQVFYDYTINRHRKTCNKKQNLVWEPWKYGKFKEQQEFVYRSIIKVVEYIETNPINTSMKLYSQTHKSNLLSIVGCSESNYYRITDLIRDIKSGKFTEASKQSWLSKFGE